MTKHLDPRFAKIVALMESTEHEGEKQAARKRAEAIAASCGMTFDEAMKASAPPAVPEFVNIFEGFDDWMEEREPGYKAQKAAETSKRENDRRVRLEALVDRYGSVDAITAPCEKELLIREALAPWIVFRDPPAARWTDNVDGYDDGLLMRGMPEHIRAAIAAAYPLPSTFDEAKAEYDYWENRALAFEAAYDDDIGSEVLDLPVLWRREMVRDLIVKDLHLKTLKDVLARFTFYRRLECHDKRIEDAIFRDLEAMANAESDVSTAPVQKRRRKGWTLPIAEMLRANPNCSDRRIARSCRVSPTTVGKVRASLGLQQNMRAVRRAGRIYEMSLSGQLFGSDGIDP